MKVTSLHPKHLEINAKMVPFAGFEMPVTYKGVQIEHEAVREKVGVFDVSHMGEFILEGNNALALIQKVTSNDASKLKIGQAQYSCFPTDKGGIVDDLLVYKLEDEKYLLVVNGANIEKDWNWVSIHNTEGVEMKNISDEISLLAVQGPKATALLQELTETDLSEIKYYHFSQGNIGDIKDVIISNTGYTGSGGFELYVKNEDAVKIWDLLLEQGKAFGIEPCGLASRDTLRLEKGFCLYGNDIDDTTSALEAGLGWITKFKKGDFIGKDFLANQKKEGIERKLVGFKIVGKGIARKDYLIFDKDQNQIGIVTSGTQSPTLKEGIGLGYVKTEFKEEGTEIFIQVRKKFIPAVVDKIPFL